MCLKRLCVLISTSCWATAFLNSPAQAVEGGSGFYLLGSRTTMGGFVPPPGTYATSTTYVFVGHENLEFATGGVTLSGDIDAKAFMLLPTLLHVIQTPVLGGNFGVMAILPIGWKGVTADFKLTGPASEVLEDPSADYDLAIGDPIIGATLGWHAGKWYTAVATIVNVPIGAWNQGSAANIGFNHWGLDVTAAVTWLDPVTGWEFSGAAGITFNGENTTTDYTSGDEFHFEFAGMKSVSKTVSLGLNGYYYQQVTGDTGAGAVLGSNKGEVWGIGPALNANFDLSGRPVSLSLRTFHEFDAERRVPGDAIVLLNLTIPM